MKRRKVGAPGTQRDGLGRKSASRTRLRQALGDFFKGCCQMRMTFQPWRRGWGSGQRFDLMVIVDSSTGALGRLGSLREELGGVVLARGAAGRAIFGRKLDGF